MADEKIFVDGMIVKRKPRSPDFVKCSLSFKMGDFVKFAREHVKDGWLNADIKLSKGGKLYAELDTWEPKKKAEDWGSSEPVSGSPPPATESDVPVDFPDDEIPF